MPGFTIIDNDNVLDNNDLNIQELSLLIALISFYNKEKGYAYPSYKQLMKRSRIKSRTTFINTLNSLSAREYIKRETIKGKGCRYFIKNVSIPITDIDQVQLCTQFKNIPTPSTDMDQHQVQICTTKNTNTNTNTKTIYISLKFIDDVIDKVKITKEQYDKLVNKFGKELVHKMIMSLDNYIANGKGNKYKDHYKVLNTWCNKEKGQHKTENKEQQNPNGWDNLNKFD